MSESAALDVSGVSIRHFSDADLVGALALSTTAGWNQRAEDWRMLVSLAPAGSFVAISGDRIVGTALGIDYGSFSWIAMMLVAQEFRGRGLGRRLLAAALEAVPADTPVRLDATPLGRPLYEAFGFAGEAALTRWVAGASNRELPAMAAAGGLRVRRLMRADLPAIAGYDRDVFGASRRTLLEWVLDSAPQYAHVIDGAAAGDPPQYCLGRPGRLFDQIGPIVADSVDSAQALAREALEAAHGRAVVMDVFDEHPGIDAWLQACGFEAQRPLFRMRLLRRAGQESGVEGLPDGAAGAELNQLTSLRQFAILGPDFA